MYYTKLSIAFLDFYKGYIRIQVGTYKLVKVIHVEFQYIVHKGYGYYGSSLWIHENLALLWISVSQNQNFRRLV
jgi:hypothetical protein